MNETGTGKTKRILAIAGLLFFAGVFISLIIHLARNAEPGVILAHLFCLIVVPCLFYVFLLLRRIRREKTEKK